MREPADFGLGRLILASLGVALFGMVGCTPWEEEDGRGARSPAARKHVPRRLVPSEAGVVPVQATVVAEDLIVGETIELRFADGTTFRLTELQATIGCA